MIRKLINPSAVILKMYLPLLSHGSDAGDNLSIYALLGIPFGGLLMYFGFQEWNKFKKVADTPTSKVRSMAAGLVELNGKVAPIKKLISPITNQECVYYKVEHQIYVRSKHSGSWITTNTKTEFENFFLDDSTGKVEIDPKLAEIDIPLDKIEYKNKLLAKERDVEYVLAVGDTVFVLGTAKNKPGVKTAKNQENFIVTKGESDPFYYITDKKEVDVQAKISTSAKFMIVAGAVIAVASVAYLVYLFFF